MDTTIMCPLWNYQEAFLNTRIWTCAYQTHGLSGAPFKLNFPKSLPKCTRYALKSCIWQRAIRFSKMARSKLLIFLAIVESNAASSLALVRPGAPWLWRWNMEVAEDKSARCYWMYFVVNICEKTIDYKDQIFSLTLKNTQLKNMSEENVIFLL